MVSPDIQRQTDLLPRNKRRQREIDLSHSPPKRSRRLNEIPSPQKSQDSRITHSSNKTDERAINASLVRAGQRGSERAEESIKTSVSRSNESSVLKGANSDGPSEGYVLARDFPLEYGRQNAESTAVLPKMWVKNQIFPILEIIARSVLLSLSGLPADNCETVFDRNSSEATQNAWDSMETLFSHAKRLVGQESTFLDEIDDSDNSENNREIIWVVNFTAALYLLSAQERVHDHLFQLHERFFDIFCDGNNELQQWQTSLLIDIKRDLWATGVQQGRFTEAEGLRNIFFLDHDEYRTSQVLQRECLKASKTLAIDMRQLKQYSNTYIESYKEQFQQLARKALSLTAPKPERCDSTREDESGSSKDNCGGWKWVKAHSNAAELNETTPIVDSDGSLEHQRRLQTRLSTTPIPNVHGEEDFGEAARYQSQPTTARKPNAAEDATRSCSELNSSVNETSFQSHHTRATVETSIREQYERAKLAASAKSTSRNKGMPLQQSQRRPWSAEEEHALMAGLDRVQGPHWSQILAMYGQSGSINEILKDRNQVQLKDKARNLKLFFLKSGQEVPHYLKNVTGELKNSILTQVTKENGKDLLDETVLSANSGEGTCQPIRDRSRHGDEQMASDAQPRIRASIGNGQLVPESDKGDGKPKQGNDDDEDLSNAIQLALQAIQEKGNAQQLGDINASRPDQRVEQHRREGDDALGIS